MIITYISRFYHIICVSGGSRHIDSRHYLLLMLILILGAVLMVLSSWWSHCEIWPQGDRVSGIYVGEMSGRWPEFRKVVGEVLTKTLLLTCRNASVLVASYMCAYCAVKYDAGKGNFGRSVAKGREMSGISRCHHRSERSLCHRVILWMLKNAKHLPTLGPRQPTCAISLLLCSEFSTTKN